MVYGAIIGLIIAFVIGLVVVFLICALLVGGFNDLDDEYRTLKSKKKGKK